MTGNSETPAARGVALENLAKGVVKGSRELFTERTVENRQGDGILNRAARIPPRCQEGLK